MKHAQTAAQVLFDSNYSSINVSDLLSALESDPKLVYVDKVEMFSVPLIKMGTSVAFFGSVCEHPESNATRFFSQTYFHSRGEKSDQVQRREVE